MALASLFFCRNLRQEDELNTRVPVAGGGGVVVVVVAWLSSCCPCSSMPTPAVPAVRSTSSWRTTPVGKLVDILLSRNRHQRLLDRTSEVLTLAFWSLGWVWCGRLEAREEEGID